MSHAEESMFPFDGSCEGSRNADIAIVFAGGESLSANARHLCEASTVLRTAIEDCKHNGMLEVGHDSREAWVLLLNLIHPGRKISVPDFGTDPDYSKLEAYATLAQKYGVTCVLDYVDVGLRQVVQEFISKASARIDPLRLHEAVDNVESPFSRRSRLVARFRLERTKKAHLEYIEKVLAGVKAFRCSGTPSGRKVGPLMSKHVKSLAEEGDYQFAAMVAEKALLELQI